MIALLAALKEELSDLRRQMGMQEVLARPACRLYRGETHGRQVLLAQTGMGRERAEAATRLVLERYPVTTLISFGFAGALTSQLDAGDLVICSTLHCAAEPAGQATPPVAYRSDEGLVQAASQAAERAAVKFYVGSNVTVPQVASTPGQRQELAQAFQADTVDMESYWIARIAWDRQIPFLGLRAISDTPRDALPPFDQMVGAEGKLQWREAAAYFLGHPRRLALLPALARNARVARHSLTLVLVRLLPLSRDGETG